MSEKSVIIKGVGDGFRLILDKSISKNNLFDEVSQALIPLSHLIKGAHIYIDSEYGSDEIARELFSFLNEKFFVESVKPFKNHEEIKAELKQRVRTREVERGWKNSRSDVLMITGRVRSGQKIDASKHLIIYGDVNPGAEVIAGGDIIILGALCGTAIAGQKQDNGSVIFALDFRPSQIQINDVVGVGGAKKSIKLPEIAFLNNSGELEITSYLDQNPFSKLPWPEVR
ncbi:MAG: septum site-determining protein MinC [Desulfobacteraceae bacterium]|nr:septum site-determining protein MinC [Desulfobacteraceae bacterium]